MNSEDPIRVGRRRKGPGFSGRADAPQRGDPSTTRDKWLVTVRPVS